jgi:hypothetical protein
MIRLDLLLEQEKTFSLYTCHLLLVGFRPLIRSLSSLVGLFVDSSQKDSGNNTTSIWLANNARLLLFILLWTKRPETEPLKNYELGRYNIISR